MPLFVFAEEKKTGTLLKTDQARRIPGAGLENVFQLTENVFSGSSPTSTVDFNQLRELGVKTVISVDGAKPEAEAARALGLKYIHIPLGYDGFSGEQQLRLIKAAGVSAHPIYIHCHHGKHRGPTAAAVICMAESGWDKQTALSWMQSAGTATNYTGLFATIQELQLPSADALRSAPANFPEMVEVSPMIDAMVLIDERFEQLKLVKDAGFDRPSSHPDLDPAHETLMLEEAFRELLRSPDTLKADPKLTEQVNLAAEGAKQLRHLLEKPHDTKESLQALTTAFKQLSAQCSGCHRSFRD